MRPASRIRARNSRQRTLIAFSELLKKEGFTKQPAQSLVVPYFSNELNRCINHDELNQALRAESTTHPPKWYTLTPVCRLNDTRKVQNGLHSTIFEVLASIETGTPESIDRTRHSVTDLIVRFLVDELGLERKRLLVTFFAGGEVLPGVNLAPDFDWQREWRQHGLRASNLLGVSGMKNFVLFVGEVERSGPKCEILYRIGWGRQPRWIELGTAIIDTNLVLRGQNGWELQHSKRIVGGIAFGLERLEMAQRNSDSLIDTELIGNLCKLVESYSTQPVKAHPFLEGDVLILVDQLRSAMFILADTADQKAAVVGIVLQNFIRRIRRKIAILDVKDWASLVKEILGVIARYYKEDYPMLERYDVYILELLESVDWPISWNPDSYAPPKQS